MFRLSTRLKPAGDQIKAIETIVKNFKEDHHTQVLLGVTGSGKTFTMANVIEQLQIPTLILAPNKTLAAQLFEEMRELLPNNAIEYFVSYYDYYQPEAYKPASNTYIPKESQRNQRIDQLRHSATRALCEHKHVIVIASVSCLYGLGSVEAYKETVFVIEVGNAFQYDQWNIELNMLQYVESIEKKRGTFFFKKITENNLIVIIYPAHLENNALFVHVENDVIVKIEQYEEEEIHSVVDTFNIYPNTHHIVQKETIEKATKLIEEELEIHLKLLKSLGKDLEASRLEEKTKRDIQLLKLTLTCPGVENYSRFFTNRSEGQPPPTLYEFFPKPFLCIVDESHIMIPQIKAMSQADKKRKENLIEYGFRLPSALDNRPLTFTEWNVIRNKTLFVSATPAAFELSQGPIVEQVIRPTGLVDPIIEVRNTEKQLENAIHAAKQVIEAGYRVIMLTLTKKMAEKVSEYLISLHMKSEYIHADVKTLARIKILQNLRKGVIDIVVGINLLREGIDIPECGLVIIFDADQEGYLRSQTALIQMIGRAARNNTGKVIMYADKITKSMEAAIDETDRRRTLQIEHNLKHNIVPTTTIKPISSAFDILLQAPELQRFFEIHNPQAREQYVKTLELKMKAAAQDRDFETAIALKEVLKIIKQSGLLPQKEKTPQLPKELADNNTDGLFTPTENNL